MTNPHSGPWRSPWTSAVDATRSESGGWNSNVQGKEDLKGCFFPATTLTLRRAEARGRAAELKKRSKLSFLTSLLSSPGEALVVFWHLCVSMTDVRQPDSHRRHEEGLWFGLRKPPSDTQINIQRESVQSFQFTASCMKNKLSYPFHYHPTNQPHVESDCHSQLHSAWLPGQMVNWKVAKRWIIRYRRCVWFEKGGDCNRDASESL